MDGMEVRSRKGQTEEAHNSRIKVWVFFAQQLFNFNSQLSKMVSTCKHPKQDFPAPSPPPQK